VSTSPEQIRDDIERTRAGLSDDVNQLAETVDPRQIAHRQADKVKGAVVGVKDRVMGSDEQDGMAHAAASSPKRAAGWAKQRTSGNPWAAGVIALGVGWMIGSMLPASTREKEAVERIAEKAKPMVGDEVGSVAGQMADHLREPVTEAVESVKSTAADAAGTLKVSAGDAMPAQQG
jgi:ElaB/YqjD/DUF883 family membrane-anchored ribosome-binding protein